MNGQVFHVISVHFDVITMYDNRLCTVVSLCNCCFKFCSSLSSYLSLPLFPFVRDEVLPATFSPPHLLVFSTLLCLLSSSSLPPLLPSSHYLTDLVVPYVPARSLRSADLNLLTVKRYNLERYGRRSFSVAGPSLWNALPSAIRNSVSLPAFRSSLKTHLFREAFVTLV